MHRNVGSADRLIRVVLGLGIIAVGIASGTWWGAIGIVPLATGLLGWCPAYLPFGLTSCRVKTRSAK